MTEEIIIDGVDVSGCGFRHKNTDNQCHIALAFSEDYGECWHCEQIENCYYKQLKHLEQELKWANNEEKYLKGCCIKAGKELEKHSFKWDGKEKNLVVQALQLNQLYEKLEQENKELKELIGKTRYNRLEMYESFETECNKYRSALEEIREICKCSKSPMNCDECPQNDDCEELCVNDENLQDIIYDKITEVLND